MGKKSLLIAVFCLCVSLSLVAADTKSAPPASMSAAQIVDKNVAARGGLQAWRSVQTLSLSGKLDAGTGSNNAAAQKLIEGRKGHQSGMMELMDSKEIGTKKDAKQVQLPFVMDMKRPGKSRVEIEFAGKTSIQVYDGANGWKVRPFLNRNDVEPFTPDEVKLQAQNPELDGLLIDYAAKGSKIELDGTEKVEGKDAYKLKVTDKAGNVRSVWIDAQTFLDVKVQGMPRKMDGKMHNVYLYQRDFRSVQGVLVPFVTETAVEGYPGTHKMSVEKVEVNPKLDDALFAKPKV
jgi:outer membrane lipoprotein-sorting protein